MKSRSKLVWIRLNFRVNDLEFREGLMRPNEQDATDFQNDFDLQMRDREGVRGWRKVSLEELKMALLETFGDVGATRTEEQNERSTPLAGLADVSDAPNGSFLPRIPIEGDSSHINRATEALSRGRVKYQIVGGIGSQRQVWGHATLLVDSLSCARTLSRRISAKL